MKKVEYFDDLPTRPEHLKANQESLKSYLVSRQEMLGALTESYGNEARQFLGLINVAGVAGALTYMAAFEKTSDIPQKLWCALSSFSTGIVLLGLVLAINVFSFRVFHTFFVDASDSMMSGRANNGLTLSDFSVKLEKKDKCLRAWSTCSDVLGVLSGISAILGLLLLVWLKF